MSSLAAMLHYEGETARTAAADAVGPAQPAASVALYVSTSLDTWATGLPVSPDQDAMCEACGFRRLDPEYYAWLRHKMEVAQSRNQHGRLTDQQYDSLRVRFNALHVWAVNRFGEQVLLEVVGGFDACRYRPPTVLDPDRAPESAPEARAPDHLWPADGDWQFTERVSADAVAKVDAVRDQALALGWSEASLYQNRGHLRFPAGDDYGLVCLLDADDRIGDIAREFIEIIRPTGSRQRFHNREIDQP
jgi:hypothetical protein